MEPSLAIKQNGIVRGNRRLMASLGGLEKQNLGWTSRNCITRVGCHRSCCFWNNQESACQIRKLHPGLGNHWTVASSRTTPLWPFFGSAKMDTSCPASLPMLLGSEYKFQLCSKSRRNWKRGRVRWQASSSSCMPTVPQSANGVTGIWVQVFLLVFCRLHSF